MIKRIISFLLVACMMLAVCASQINALHYIYLPAEGFFPYYDCKKIENKWYHDGAFFLLDQYLFKCFDGQEFRYDHDFYPNKPVLRKEAAALITGYDWDYFYYNHGYGTSINYKDMPLGMYAYSADWCYKRGIMNGYCKGYFVPDATLTREEFMTIMYRYTLYKGIDTEASSDAASSFSDYGKVSPWARDAIDWACAIGLMNGKTKTTLNTRECVTRAEMATLAYRYNNLVLAHTDNNPDKEN